MRPHRSAPFYAALLLGAALSGTGCELSGTAPAADDLHKNPIHMAIMRLGASEVTDTSAVVTWQTSRPTVGALRYGLTPDLGVTQTRVSPFATAHEVKLAELTPATQYYYRVQAISDDGDTLSTRGVPFTTDPSRAANDPTAPVLSEVEVSGVTSSSALIRWQSDDLTRGRILYGTTFPYSSSTDEYPSDPQHYSRRHALALTGLQENTQYRFAVQATNPAGLTGYSSEATFTTRAAPHLAFCPDTVSVGPAESFDLAICVGEARDLAGVALTLQYDPAALEIVGGTSAVTAGPFFVDSGGHLFMPATIDPVAGRLALEASWLIDYEGDLALGTAADGEGVLCTVRCRLKAGASVARVDFSLADQDGDGRADTQLLDYNRLPITFGVRRGVILQR